MRDLTEIRATLRAAFQATLAAGAVLVALASSATAQEAARGGSPTADAAPMTKLLHRVQETFPGRILTVDLDAGAGTEEDPATYEVKVLTSGGNVLKLFYDARTLRLERILGRHRSDHEPRGATNRDGGGSSGRSEAGSHDGPGHDSGDDHSGSDDGSDDGSDHDSSDD